MLQCKDANIQKAVCLIQNSVQALTAYGSDFTDVKRSAQAIAQKWGVRCEFTLVRARKVKQHYDELCKDERLGSVTPRATSGSMSLMPAWTLLSISYCRRSFLCVKPVNFSRLSNPQN